MKDIQKKLKAWSDALLAALRTPLGRVALVACGVGGVSLIVCHLGMQHVIDALEAGAPLFPIVLGLEIAQLGCSMLALRSLYGDAGKKVPAGQLVRAGLIGYAIMGLVPAGRAVAEVAKAAMLSRWVGSTRSAQGAVRMQAVALICNAGISVAATIAVYLAVGPSLMTLAIAGNFVITSLLGGGLLLVERHKGLGAWIGKRLGSDEQEHAQPGEGERSDKSDKKDQASAPLISAWPSIAWEGLGRCIQVVQNMVLVVAVGGAFGLRAGLASEALHLVGAAVGEIVPAQLGFTEANFTLQARALALPAATAVAIPLLAHVVQLTWVLVGSLVPLVWAGPAPRTSPAPATEGSAA